MFGTICHSSVVFICIPNQLTLYPGKYASVLQYMLFLCVSMVFFLLHYFVQYYVVEMKVSTPRKTLPAFPPPPFLFQIMTAFAHISLCMSQTLVKTHSEMLYVCVSYPRRFIFIFRSCHPHTTPAYCSSRTLPKSAPYHPPLRSPRWQQCCFWSD